MEPALGRRHDLTEIERRGKGLHDLVQGTEEIVGGGHLGVLVAVAEAPRLLGDPELTRERADAPAEAEHQRGLRPVGDVGVRGLRDEPGEGQRAGGDRGGRDALAVPPPEAGQHHRRDRHEHERTRPLSAHRECDDTDREFGEDGDLGGAVGVAELQRTDRAERRVHREDDGRRDVARVGDVAGGREEEQADTEGAPAQDDEERTEVLADRGLGGAGTAVGPTRDADRCDRRLLEDGRGRFDVVVDDGSPHDRIRAGGVGAGGIRARRGLRTRGCAARLVGRAAIVVVVEQSPPSLHPPVVGTLRARPKGFSLQ